ncbi:MAG: serine/threonine-protein kinase [Cyanobacteriota bacterium]
MTDTQNGRLLANRYKLVEILGKGAMGSVYRAEDTVLGNVSVAIKFLSMALLKPAMRDRFKKEATISALLGEKSVHIIRVRDYGVDEHEIPFYVMEFLQGKSLSELIQEKPLSLSQFLNYTRQMCSGLQSAHEGIIFEREKNQIIHRDIKPSNILVTQDTTFGELVKILDFGVAKLVQEDGQQTQSFMGTLAYCSPEQMEGEKLDHRSDIYSLGVMMYEMLTGEMPLFPEVHSFSGWYNVHHKKDPKPFNPALNVPPTIQNLIMGCLAKNREERPNSVTDILETLDRFEASAGKSLQTLQVQPLHSPSPAHLEKSKTHLGTQTSTTSAEALCFQMTWPKDKPKAKIVFPRLIRTSEEVLVTLWVMLSQQDIDRHRFSTRYNHFLYVTSPHPMLLWITGLYHRDYGPNWLPCYLDLKTSVGQRLTRLLADTGSYRILFFAVDDPKSCKNVRTVTIDPTQCQTLRQWSKQSHAHLNGQPQLAKELLKQEFERLKPTIEMKLEAVHH